MNQDKETGMRSYKYSAPRLTKSSKERQGKDSVSVFIKTTLSSEMNIASESLARMHTGGGGMITLGVQVGRLWSRKWV